MRSSLVSAPLLRSALLLLLSSQGLHHLRYLLAPDHDRGLTLARHGDAWHLVATGPGIAVMTALAVAALVVRAASSPSLAPVRSTRVRRIWPLAAMALLVTYASQELLEGVLGHGHEQALAGLVGSGGWVVLPLAVALGGLVALVVGITRAADALVLGPDVRFVVVVASLMTLVHGTYSRLARPVLSEHGAGRAPPVVA